MWVGTLRASRRGRYRLRQEVGGRDFGSLRVDLPPLRDEKSAKLNGA